MATEYEQRATEIEFLPSSPKQAKAHGSRFYFTGKPCKRGHFSKRYSGSASCVECLSENIKNNYRENKQHHYEASRKWAINNPDKVAKIAKRAREKDPEKYRAWARKYAGENLDKEKSRWAKYKSMNKDEIREKRKEYIEKNREKINVYNAARQRKNRDQMPSWADMEKIKEFYKMAAHLRTTGLSVDVDHIVPIVSKSVCGFHCESNLEIVYSIDNSKKGNSWWPGDLEHQGMTGMYK